jgi:hypothetical protein
MGNIGRIAVPTYPAAGTFPIVPDMGWGMAIAPRVSVHPFLSANGKIEQRYLLGSGARRFRFTRRGMNEAERNALRAFWEARSGPYQPFTYNAPTDDGAGTTPYTVRFDDAPFTWDFVSNAVSSTGLELVEEVSTNPAYVVAGTDERFAGAPLLAGLLAQEQDVIPLVKIRVGEAAVPSIFLSTRRCVVGGQQYEPRVLGWKIRQSMQGGGHEGGADDVRIQLGNADRVITQLVQDTDCTNALVEFSFYHVATQRKLDFWRGFLYDFAGENEPVFDLFASDILYPVELVYPPRTVTRYCWKEFNDGQGCPGFDGGINLSVPCDKGYDTPQGCVYHNLAKYHGGIAAKPQEVRVKDNSTGTWGWGRDAFTSSSQVAEGIMGETLPEIYFEADTYDSEGALVHLPVNCKVAAARDEGDFVDEIGVIGVGPIAEFGPDSQFLADGQPPHGPGHLGLRLCFGDDPVNEVGFRPDANSHEFGLGQGGAGVQTYPGATRAAGTAFCEIRRVDEKGMQYSRVGDRSMQASIKRGLQRWAWSGAGARALAVLTNPAWVAVNAFLNGIGLRFASAAVAEDWFDLNAALAAGSLCDWIVPKLVGAGTEKQFRFKGVIQEQKPLRDWEIEILNNALAYYSFAFGKLRIGTRSNSSAVDAFDAGNIVAGTLKLSPLKPKFNYFEVHFADEEYGFILNHTALGDVDHQKRLGSAIGARQVKPGQISLSGCSTKSHALRINRVRLREELGGATAAEWARAREGTLRSTFLAVNTEPGAVIRVDHEDVPGGTGEFRVLGYTLNDDFSMDFEVRTSTDSMYDDVSGPKPADVTANKVPMEYSFAPADWNFSVETSKNGKLVLKNFTCKTNNYSVDKGVFEVYYIPEAEGVYGSLDGMPLPAEDTTIHYFGAAPRDGEFALIEDEILKIVSTDPASKTASVIRGENVFNDPLNVAVEHNRAIATIDSKVGQNIFTLLGVPEKGIRPGDAIIHVEAVGTGEEYWSWVGQFDSDTGRLVCCTNLPIAEVGHTINHDPRIWPVTFRTEIVNFGAKFFRTEGRARFEHVIDLPFAGVVAVRGWLENGQGIKSEPLLKMFTVQPQARLRTLGTTQYVFPYDGLPGGARPNAFQLLRAERTQTFERGYLVRESSFGPIQAPRAVSALVPANYLHGGTIIIGGAPAAGDQISIEIGNPANDSVYLLIPRYEVNVTDGLTPGAIAQNLSYWLNGTEEFVAFYRAEYSGAEVRIFDKCGVNGQISVSVSGGVTAVASGVSAKLGINQGRRYAGCFSGPDYRSDLSPLSNSTGPTGGATRVEINECQVSQDTRVNTFELYAAPDGADGPLYLIGTNPNDGAQIVDTVTEELLPGLTPYPGATLPPAAGTITALVKQNGGQLVFFRIDADKAMSEELNGLGIGAISQGTELTVDLTNNSGEPADVRLILE